MSTSKALANDEHQLLDRVTRWPEYASLAELTPDVLCKVSQQKGIDVATALLFDRIVRSPEHRRFVERIHELQQRNVATPLRIDATVAFAPGAFYVEYPQTGADAAALRAEAARFGCPTELIPSMSIGTPTENGRIICEWLSRQTVERVILVSLSKGGADVKMALAQPESTRAFRNVVAWINLGGILKGSPMAAWALSRRLPRSLCRLLFWIRGRDFQFVRELERRAGNTLDFEMKPPEHMKLIHVAGFPLSRHTSGRRARRWHGRLATYGPNDSVMILSDVCEVPGLVLPVFGTDHYLSSGWDVRRLVSAILLYLGEDLNLFDNVEKMEMRSG